MNKKIIFVVILLLVAFGLGAALNSQPEEEVDSQEEVVEQNDAEDDYDDESMEDEEYAEEDVEEEYDEEEYVEEDDDFEGWSSYESGAYDFQFKYPSGWGNYDVEEGETESRVKAVSFPAIENATEDPFIDYTDYEIEEGEYPGMVSVQVSVYDVSDFNSASIEDLFGQIDNLEDYFQNSCFLDVELSSVEDDEIILNGDEMTYYTSLKMMNLDRESAAIRNFESCPLGGHPSKMVYALRGNNLIEIKMDTAYLEGDETGQWVDVFNDMVSTFEFTN